MAAADFNRRRNLWIGITLSLFLAHDFWIFIVLTTVILLLAIPRENNKLAAFFFLLFAAPSFRADIPGLVVSTLFTIDYIRLLAFVILLPAFLDLRREASTPQFGLWLPDKLITAYIVLLFALTMAASTFTHALRSGVLYSFLDIFLPYYVASRLPKKLQDFRDVLSAFVIAGLVISAIAIFEYARHWLLYAGLDDVLGINSGMIIYLKRGDDTLRAVASAGHAIPLGYAIAVAFGFFLYVKKLILKPLILKLALFLLVAGLLAPVSRGPWVGATAIILVFSATSANPFKNLVRLALFGAAFTAILLVLPTGEKFLDLIPFLGQADEETVNYRQRLLEVAISVVLQNPFFGAYDYLYSPALQEMKQGQGIIDIVNSYLGIALANGLVGLSLFSGFFAFSVFSIFKGMRRIKDRNSELYILGQALLSTLMGILITIFTVSSITIIPVIYWSVAGLGIAYAHMVTNKDATSPEIENFVSAPIRVNKHIRTTIS